MSTLVDALREGLSGTDALDLHEAAARARVERLREALTSCDEAAAQTRFPLSALYHDTSRLDPLTRIPLSPAQVVALTHDGDHKHAEGARTALSAPLPSAASLTDAFAGRASQRSFDDRALSLDAVSDLLGWSCGVVDPTTRPPRRSAPSPGALYGVVAHLLAFRVSGVATGAHLYDPDRHDLTMLRPLTGPGAAWPLLWPVEHGVPAAAIVLTARLDRVQSKYAERGYRFVLLEAGHIAQNVLLMSAALGLAAVPVGGFVDREVDHLVDADGVHEVSLYGVLLGHPGVAPATEDGPPPRIPPSKRSQNG